MPTRFVGRGYAPDTRRPSSGRYRLAVGKRCAGLFGEADFLPRRALGQQRAHKLVVESVAGLVALEGADDGVAGQVQVADRVEDLVAHELVAVRSEEHTSELQSLMRISYAVFCLKKKTKTSMIHIKTKCRELTSRH